MGPAKALDAEVATHHVRKGRRWYPLRTTLKKARPIPTTKKAGDNNNYNSNNYDKGNHMTTLENLLLYMDFEEMGPDAYTRMLQIQISKKQMPLNLA